MLRCVLERFPALIPTIYLSTSNTASAPIDFVRAGTEVESCLRCADQRAIREAYTTLSGIELRSRG